MRKIIFILIGFLIIYPGFTSGKMELNTCKIQGRAIKKYNPIINRLKNGESYTIEMISDGDWHSVESVLLIKRHKKEYIAEFEGYYNTELIKKNKKLTKKDIKAIQSLELEIFNFKKSKGWCTTTDKYIIKYKNERIEIIDNECKWNGLNHLIKELWYEN